MKWLKHGVGQGFIFHAIIYAHYIFLAKRLLVKLKNLHTSVCLNLNYGTTKQKQKKGRVQRW